MVEATVIQKKTRTLGFFLTDGFALMSYASMIEPFRAANVLSGQPLYDWVHISPHGLPAKASNGAAILTDTGPGGQPVCDMLLVFAAGDPAGFKDDGAFRWFRQLARAGTILVGISGGPFLLALAGLLDGYRATIHWDHRASFTERFPRVAVEPGLYVIDGPRVTCAGGTAGLDLAIELIERDQGRALAAAVSDWFIRTELRSADMPQRLGLGDRYATRNDRVVRVLAYMEANIEAPPSREMLAQIAGVSMRQLERLFQSHLGEGVAQGLMRIRLERAEHLLRSTTLPVTAIGLACGFSSSSYFSQAFRARYYRSPREYRVSGRAPV